MLMLVRTVLAIMLTSESKNLMDEWRERRRFHDNDC